MTVDSTIKHKIKTMLSMQDDMNSKINPDWRQAGNAWYRAIFIECAELMDHYGWKWWKKQQPDIAQVQMELVDIWHFGLSKLLETHDSIDNAFTTISIEALLYKNDEYASLCETDFLNAVELFAADAVIHQTFSTGKFVMLLQGVGLSFDELYKQYVGKNTLNFFRQDHGYKDGSYRKHWHDGREDNEHLVEIINNLDHDSVTFKDNIYGALTAAYSV